MAVALDCECKLERYSRCDRKIDVAVLLQRETAIKTLPVIYLAKRDIEEQGLKGPLQNWSLNIAYRDSKGSSEDAAFEAFQLHQAGNVNSHL